MNKELYVSSTPHETKVALMEDDQLAEVFFERENEYTLAGSIYKGRVTRVLPGMQSAFVDIGLERDAFLYVSDFLELSGEEEEDEEFGEIPAPRGAIDLSKPQQGAEFHAAETQPGTTTPDSENDADLESIFEEEAPAPTGRSTRVSIGRRARIGDGARRWRGRRRRRGGRRGRGPEQEPAESKPTAAAAPTPVSRWNSRRLGPNRVLVPATVRRRIHADHPAGRVDLQVPQPAASCGRAASAERERSCRLSRRACAFRDLRDLSPSSEEVEEEIQEESTHLDQGYSVAEPEPTAAPSAVEAEQVQAAAANAEEQPPRSRRRWGWRRKAANAEVAAPVEQEQTQPVPQAAEDSSSEPQKFEVAEAQVGEDVTQSSAGNETASAESGWHQQDHTPHHDVDQSIAAEAGQGIPKRSLTLTNRPNTKWTRQPATSSCPTRAARRAVHRSRRPYAGARSSGRRRDGIPARPRRSDRDAGSRGR